ncbi:MAG: glycosyltransferase family 39 protein [Anaerolineales bacterium]|nr:glycosyltransferase family 39 protein [Anaerolineales bacterium]
MTPAPVVLKRWPAWWTQPLLWLMPLLLVGLWLRLSYLLGSVYFYDEFISMLAALMTAQKGGPVLPSGLFYDHGLLFSYLSGALIALLGFKEEIARWPVLWLSVVTIAAYYLAARRLFGSVLAGVLAATLAALDETSIIWGGRARMYTPAHLFVLLTIAWFLLGTLHRPAPRTRYLALLFLAAALFSHTMTFLILPPLSLLLLGFTWLYRRDWLRQPRLWQAAAVGLVIVALALSVVAGGMNNPSAKVIVHPDAAAAAPPPLGLSFLRGFIWPGLEWGRFDNLVGFFEEPPYDWLRPIIGLALLLAGYRIIRRRANFRDVALLFLALFLGLVIFEMGALLTDTWSKSRYVFIPALPGFLLLSAGSLAHLLSLPLDLAAKLGQQAQKLVWLKGAVALAGVILIALLWGPRAWNVAQTQGTGDYNTAFAYVKANWQPGDRLMTTHPAAAYLYLGFCDYYANQVSASVFRGEGEDSALVDRYAASPLVDSVKRLNDILGQGQRLWFVVDEQRLYERFEPFFTQQILAQMDLVEQTGTTYIFRSRPYPTPLLEQPSVRLEANFSEMIRLEGYYLDPADLSPDGTLPLGLYWRPVAAPPRQFKVFVQLRNAQNQIIAQADHFLLEGLLTVEAWNVLQQKGEWLRDTADLNLSLPLPAGGEPYQLYVGFYDPKTLERVPLIGDTSAENAVIIRLPPAAGVAR